VPSALGPSGTLSFSDMKYLARKLLAGIVPLMSLACATIGPPQPPSLDLPKPPTDLHAFRKGDRVILTWTIPSATTDRQTITTLGATRICRGPADMKSCGTPVGQTASQTQATKASDQKKAASYSDALPPEILQGNDNPLITYAVEVLNHDGRSAGLSNEVHVSLIRTMPPPQDLHAEVTSQGVVLTWTGESAPSGSTLRYVYRVYRHTLENSEQTLVGELPANNQRQVSLTDSNIEWQKTYEYRAETVTVISEPGKSEVQIEGDDTPEIKVFANDIFPPAVPSGLQAVFSGPGQSPFIDLVWAPVTDLDLAGYNVYRHEQGGPVVKLNSELLKAPAYRDSKVESGKLYFYSVSAVDARNNESDRSEEASEAVP